MNYSIFASGIYVEGTLKAWTKKENKLLDVKNHICILYLFYPLVTTQDS